jgi:hypothetical protein
VFRQALPAAAWPEAGPAPPTEEPHQPLCAGPGGQALVVSDPRGKPGPYGPGYILGVLTANTFTPIPNGADPGRSDRLVDVPFTR